MRRATLVTLLSLLTGCTGGTRDLFTNAPQPTTPAPSNVREEIRDARYFLPYPDQEVGPATGLQPRTMRRGLGSH